MMSSEYKAANPLALARDVSNMARRIEVVCDMGRLTIEKTMRLTDVEQGIVSAVNALIRAATAHEEAVTAWADSLPPERQFLCPRGEAAFATLDWGESFVKGALNDKYPVPFRGYANRDGRHDRLELTLAVRLLANRMMICDGGLPPLPPPDLDWKNNKALAAIATGHNVVWAAKDCLAAVEAFESDVLGKQLAAGNEARDAVGGSGIPGADRIRREAEPFA